MQTHPFTVKSTAICQPDGRAMVFGQTEIPEGTVLLGFRGSLTTGVYKDPDLSDIDLLGAWIPGPEYYFGLTRSAAPGSTGPTAGTLYITSSPSLFACCSTATPTWRRFCGCAGTRIT